MTECRVVTVEKNADCTVDAEKIIETVNRTGARMLVFSNPCNPTSLVLAREEVRKIVSSVEALVVLDEAYMDFSDQSMLSEFAGFDNLLILKTCSKALGMAAVRLGFAVGTQRLIDVLQAAKSPYNVNTLTQAIARSCSRTPITCKRRCSAYWSRATSCTRVLCCCRKPIRKRNCTYLSRCQFCVYPNAKSCGDF